MIITKEEAVELGMLEEHVEELRQFCSDNKTISILRPLNRQTASRLAQGLNPKMLATKGKSSEFILLMGLVPYYAILSKLSKDMSSNESYLTAIKEYQRKNDLEISNSEQKYAELKPELDALIEEYKKMPDQEPKAETSGTLSSYFFPKKPKKSPKEIKLQAIQAKIELLNQTAYSTKISKKVPHDGQEFDLLFFPHSNRFLEPDLKNTTQPLFAIKRGNKFLFYDYEKETFSEIDSTGIDTSNPKVVELMAYKTFSFNESEQQLSETVFPITADYDLLMMAGRKLSPINNETLLPIIQRDIPTLTRELSISDSPPLAKLRRVFFGLPTTFSGLGSSIFDSKKNQKEVTKNIASREFEDYKYDIAYYNNESIQNMGFGNVSLQDTAIVGYFRRLLRNAINHGAETENQYAEPFGDGDHICFDEKGEINLFKNPQEICDFVNTKRRSGFLLPVNPQWGWVKDETTGDLKNSSRTI